jgi:hypothetical protein
MKKEQFLPGVHAFYVPEMPAAVLDILTSTRYYRTSLLTEVRLITIPGGNEAPAETVWTLEKESDDFDILMELSEALKGIKLLITFNGDSFDIPHLTKKYAAYRLEDPFEGKHTLDLLKKLRLFDPLFHLPAHTLSDYMGLFPENETLPAQNDAEAELLLTSLLPLEGFMNGNFAVENTDAGEDFVTFTLLPGTGVPISLTSADGPFTLTLREDRAFLKADLFDGRLRRYYLNYRDYEYLIHEGYAVHRSVSQSVAKSRKEKAVRENCFSFFKCTEKFLEDKDSVKKYAVSALRYMIGK